MLARPSIVAMLVLTALPLGCGSHPEAALVDPTKYRFHTCEGLRQEMKTLIERTQELKVLHEKAMRGAGGEFVARIAYEPEYISAIGNIRLIETAARENDCDPPVTAASGSPPPR